MNIKAAAVAAIVVVLALFAGSSAYYRFGVFAPVGRAMAEIPEVRSYHVKRINGGILVTVRLAGVSDLGDTVEKISLATSRANRTNSVWLAMEEHADPAIARAVHELDFWVHEALVTGRFTQLARASTLIRSSEGLDRCDVSIDGGYIYVSMTNDGTEFYRIIPRQEGQNIVSPSERGVRI